MFEHQQPGDHAAVAICEVPEIMVGAHLTAVHGIFRTHPFFDECMTEFYS